MHRTFLVIFQFFHDFQSLLELCLDIFLVLKMSSTFYFYCEIFKWTSEIRLDFFMKANNMNPDQTALLKKVSNIWLKWYVEVCRKKS